MLDQALANMDASVKDLQIVQATWSAMPGASVATGNTSGVAPPPAPGLKGDYHVQVFDMQRQLCELGLMSEQIHQRLDETEKSAGQLET